MGNLEDAIELALEAHRGQKDKSGRSYILHPISVMKLVEKELEEHPQNLPEGYEVEDMLIIAILHDVVEDYDHISLQDIDLEFGANISLAVDGVTRREGETYFDFIARCKLNPAARLVKIAHNMSRISNLPKEEQSILNRYMKAERILNDKE